MRTFTFLGGSSLAAGLVSMYIVAMTGFNIWKPRILVVHSFSESSQKVKEIDEGMREKLRLNRLPVSVQWYYLNSDQPDLDAMKNSEITNISRVIDDFNPSYMILVDDRANHLMTLSPNLRRNRRIFFLGINQPPSVFGYRKGDPVAGIADVAPHQSLLELLKNIRGGTNLRITVLGSDTDVGRDLGATYERRPLGTNRIQGVHYASTWTEWQRIVQQSNQDSDILLITAIHGLRDDQNGRVVPTENVAKWTELEAKRLQPIGLSFDYVPLGGSLSVVPSAYYHGAMAMDSVLRWSEPSRKNAMPSFSLDDHFNVGMRIERLKQRGITLPLIYREAARLSKQVYSLDSQDQRVEDRGFR